MNKPIRTMAVFCLVLFLALMVNATYLQYVNAGEPQRGPPQPSGDRGGVLPRARRDPGRPQRRGRERASPTTSTSSSASTPSRCGTPTSPATSPSTPRPASSRPRTPCCPATTPRLFVTRLVDLVNNAAPKGGSVQLTLDPAAQNAAYDGLSALGDDVAGRRGGARAGAPARCWRWCRCRRTTPTSWPRTTSAAVAEAYDELLTTTPPSRCSTAPSRPRCHPARRSRSSPLPQRIENGLADGRGVAGARRTERTASRRPRS